MSKGEGGDQGAHALRVSIDPTLLAFRQKLTQVGCVFDFSVYSLEKDIDSSPALHRHALELFFTEMRERLLEEHREIIEKCPELRGTNFFHLDFDCAAASPKVLSVEQLRHLLSCTSHSTAKPCLFSSFSEPPHGLATNVDAKDLFNQWCRILGLLPVDLPEVIDWVGDFDLEPSRSEWSNYFEAGKEWWGIWCLTVWNPVTRTLGVLAASTTD